MYDLNIKMDAKCNSLIRDRKTPIPTGISTAVGREMVSSSLGAVPARPQSKSYMLTYDPHTAIGYLLLFLIQMGEGGGEGVGGNHSVDPDKLKQCSRV